MTNGTTENPNPEPGSRQGVQIAVKRRPIDWKRLFFTLLGLVLFCVIYFYPSFSDAKDPEGKLFALDEKGQTALALFVLAAVWWVFEVLPIGVTSIAIGVIQALLLVRPAKKAFSDFMDPSVWFILASITIGMAFTKTGLTRRMAYKMLVMVGERTSMIYLGCFVVTGVLTLIMAHTAVAATVYPILVTIHALYSAEDKPTKFGQGLFIGMAYVAGAGSIITLLGAARGAVALGFYSEIVGREISFFELTYYMFPIGTLMVFLLWGFIMVFFKPEKRVIPGLRQRALSLYENVGPVTSREILTLVIVLGIIITLSLRSLIPAMKVLDKSGVILIATVLFFMFKILTIEDLEEIPWNIILLFGGAMSLGFCLWETGAASWLAIKWLTLLQDAHWFVFVMGVSIFVGIMTNLIMNVAAIAISIPVALVLAPYIGVSSEVVTFSALVAAGMPFLLLIGAAPNAIAYESRQFTSGKFFTTGVPASVMLAIVLGIFLVTVWPLMGMPIAGAPSATSQSVNVGKDAPTQIILKGSDPDGEPLTFRIIDEPANGTLTGEGSEVTYTPNEEYTGPDSFTFKASDGGIDSPIATVKITVSDEKGTETGNVDQKVKETPAPATP